MQTVEGAEPASCHLQAWPHLAKDTQNLAGLNWALRVASVYRRENAINIHVRKMCRVNTDKCGVIDGEPDERILDEHSLFLAGYNQVHQLPSSGEEFARTITPEPFRHASLVHWLVEWPNRFCAAHRKERHIRPMKDDDGKEIGEVHDGVRGESVLVHVDMGIGVAGRVLQITRKGIAEFCE